MFEYLPSTFGKPYIWRYHHGQDPWALVTGASDGIGKELATQLALCFGFNVIIHGRNRPKLEKVRQEILDKLKTKGDTSHIISIRIFVLDATNIIKTDLKAALNDILVKDEDSVGGSQSEKQGQESAALTRRSSILKRKDSSTPLLSNSITSDGNQIRLTLLINNLGIVGTSLLQPLADMSTQEIIDITHANSLFPTLLTHQLIPVLVSSGPSLILTLSSGAAPHPGPYLGPYAGSKAYNAAFSRSLFNEFAVDGRRYNPSSQQNPPPHNQKESSAGEQSVIQAECIIVGAVHSAANDYTPPSMFVPTAEEFARSLLECAGSGRSSGAGCWQHALQLGLGAWFGEAQSNSALQALHWKPWMVQRREGFKQASSSAPFSEI